MRRVLISAGEASGDLYAARLVESWRLVDADLSIEGVGGRRLREAGVPLIADSSRWGAIGIIEAVKVGPRVVGGYRATKRALATGAPGLFVPIDFGYTHVRLARFAKERGWKVFYFVPPGSWRKHKQGSDLASVTDAIATPFSWSAEILTQMGANARWFGHPLKELVVGSGVDLAAPRSTIAILPGSRGHEVQRVLPVLKAATESRPEPVEAALASSVSAEAVSRLWPVGLRLTPNDTYGVLGRACAALICSGTATLEAALCRTPCVVVYRGSKSMEIEYRIRKPKFDFISLPNILLGRAVLPELIQWDATPERIRGELDRLLDEGAARQAQLAAFEELDALLGPADALSQAARWALEFVS